MRVLASGDDFAVGEDDFVFDHIVARPASGSGKKGDAAAHDETADSDRGIPSASDDNIFVFQRLVDLGPGIARTDGNGALVGGNGDLVHFLKRHDEAILDVGGTRAVAAASNRELAVSLLGKSDRHGNILRIGGLEDAEGGQVL